jgi:hypothetical protein
VACAETTCHRVAMVTTANSARQLRFSDLCNGQEPEFEPSCNYVDAWVERLCDRLAGIDQSLAVHFKLLYYSPTSRDL